MPFFAALAPLLAPALTGAAIGAGGAALTGGDPLKAGLLGGALGGGGAALGGLLAPAGGSLAGAAPIAEQGSQLAFPSLSSELAGTAGGVGNLGQALSAAQSPMLQQSLRAQQAAALLPQETPGFTQQLTSGLLKTAPALIPKQQPQRPPASGPALSRPQAQVPENLFMKFNRRRR